MRYQAVIFDLFGTLTPVFSNQGYEDTLRAMAGILDASGDDLVGWWFGSSHLRATGQIETIEAYLEHICKGMRVRWFADLCAARISALRPIHFLGNR